MDAALQPLRRRGVQVFAYLDDVPVDNGAVEGFVHATSTLSHLHGASGPAEVRAHARRGGGCSTPQRTLTRTLTKTLTMQNANQL